MALAGVWSLFDGSSKACDNAVTYYDLIMKLPSGHKKVMNSEQCYRIYVYSPFVEHHCIVLVDDKEQCGYLTLELTVMQDGNDTMQVTPKAQLYTGKIDELNYKGKVTSTLKKLSEYAFEVLSAMGSYNLAFNNCQHFCHYFLEKVGLPGHLTDTAVIGIAGVAAVGYGAYKWYTGGNEEEGSKEKEKT